MNYDSSQGVWRTIRGRRVFIKDGEDLYSAMKRSGKFKKVSDVSREEYQRNRDNIDLDNRLKKDINNTDFDDETLEIDKRIDTRNNTREYTGDTSDLYGRHIEGFSKYLRERSHEIPKEVEAGTYTGGKEAKAREIDKINKISQEEYDKTPKDYKGTLKELVDTAEFRGESKEKERQYWESKGYDVDKDKTILKHENSGTTLQPVKIEDKIKKDLSRPYIEQPDGTYADPKSPFTKRTSSELRKQIKELEPYTEELQVGNRVIINTGRGKYGVRNVGDEDDPMTDYSAYVYGFNAKSIIQRAREQGIVTDVPKTSKTTEAKVERFKERKGKTLDTMSKRELAEKIVEDQIARGVVKSENKEMLIKKKMQDYSKSDLLDYFK